MSYQYFFPTGDSAWVDDNVTEQNIFDHYSKKRPEFYPGYTYMSNLAPPAEDVSSQSLISDIFTDPYSTMVMNAPARMQLPITVSNALLTATPEQMKDPAFIQHIKDGIAEMPQELQKHTMREVHNLLNSGEYLGAGAEFAKVAVESISSALGYITPTLAASGLATVAATPIAGVATATSFTAIELLSENLTEILQDPDSTLEDIEKALPKTLAATAAQTAAEMTMLKVFGLLPGTKALFRKALNPATGKTAIKSQTAIKGINALKKAGSSVPVRLGTSAVGEGSTEVLQHLLTQWQAGKEVDFAEEDHMWEIYENFAGGFFGGAGLRGAGMGLEKMKERTILGTTELEKDKERRDSQKEAADAANREENNLRTKRLENESQRLKKLRVERESRINIGVEEATERFEVQEQDIHNIAYERRINSRDAGFAQKISEMFPGKSSIEELNSNEKFLLYEHLKEHQVQGSGVDPATTTESREAADDAPSVSVEPKDGKLESGDLSRFGMPGRVRGLNVSSIKLERLLAIKESLELVSAGPYGASAEESVAARNDLRVVEEWIKYRTGKAVNTGRDEQVLSSFSSYSDSEMSDVLSFLRKKFKRHKVKAKALTKDMLSDVLKIETYEDSIGTSKFNSVVNELVDRGIVIRESTDAFLLRMANSKNQRDSHEALEIFNYQSQVDKSGYTAEEAEYLEQRFEEMYNEKSYLVVSDSFVNQRNGRILDLASELKRFPSFEDVKKYTDIQSEETYNSTVSELERDGIVYIDDTGAVTLTRSSDDSLFKYDYSAVEKRKFAVRNSEGKIISLHDSREAALDKTKELNDEYGGFEVISNNGVIVKTFHGENAKGRAKDFVNNNRQKYTVVKDRSIVQRGLSKTQADNMVRELRREAGLSGADARRRVLSSPEVGGLRFGLNEKDYLVELPAGYSSSGRSESLFLVEESRSSSGGDYSGTSIVGVRDSLEAAANRAAQLASMRKNSAESIRGKVVKGLREGKTVEELLQENIEGLSSREASRRAKEYERLRRSRLEQEAINNTDGRLTEDQALRLETLLERESAVLERNRDIGRSENPLEDPSRQELRDIRSDPREFVGRTIARETREGRRKEPARQVDVSKDPRVKEALKELRKKFKQAGIDDVSDLKIVPTLTVENIISRGRLRQGTGFIEIALDFATKNMDKDTTSEEIFNKMLEILGHETVHVYSENGWITPRDRKRLVKFAKKNKWPNSDRTIYSVIRDTYKEAQEAKGEQHLSEERIDEEAMAFVIQLYINERGWGVNKVKSDEKIVKGPIVYIINKIAKYIKGLSNYFKASGFESIEDIVDRFLPGEISSDSVAKLGKASARLKDRVRGSFYASGDSIAGKRYKTGKGVGGRFVHEDADGLYELPEIVRMKDIEKAAEIKGFDLSKIDKKYLQERRIGQGTDSKVQDLARDPRSMRKLHNEILGVVDVYSPSRAREDLGGHEDSVNIDMSDGDRDALIAVFHGGSWDGRDIDMSKRHGGETEKGGGRLALGPGIYFAGGLDGRNHANNYDRYYRYDENKHFSIWEGVIDDTDILPTSSREESSHPNRGQSLDKFRERLDSAKNDAILFLGGYDSPWAKEQGRWYTRERLPGVALRHVEGRFPEAARKIYVKNGIKGSRWIREGEGRPYEEYAIYDRSAIVELKQTRRQEYTLDEDGNIHEVVGPLKGERKPVKTPPDATLSKLTKELEDAVKREKLAAGPFPLGTLPELQTIERANARRATNVAKEALEAYTSKKDQDSFKDQDSVMVEGGQLITDKDAHAAAQTQRGVPEDVMDEITAGADRAGFPAVLGDLLEHVGDISNRAQQRSGIAIVNVREKVDKVLRFGSRGRMSLKDDIESSRRSNAEFDLLPSLEPELRRLDDAGPEVWKSAGFKTRSDLWDAFREKHPNLKDLISEEVERQVRSEISPLSRYVDAHETHNVALTEMGKLGKDMAIHLGKGEYDALIEKARVLDGLVYEYERLKSEGRRDEAEVMRLRPAPTPRAEATTLKDQDSIYIETVQQLPSPISDDAYEGGPFSSKLPDNVRAKSRIEGGTVTFIGDTVSQMGPGLWYKRITNNSEDAGDIIKRLGSEGKTYDEIEQEHPELTDPSAKRRGFDSPTRDHSSPGSLLSGTGEELYWKYEGGREFSLWSGQKIEKSDDWITGEFPGQGVDLEYRTVKEADELYRRFPVYGKDGKHLIDSKWKSDAFGDAYQSVDREIGIFSGQNPFHIDEADADKLKEAEERLEQLRISMRDSPISYPEAEGARRSILEAANPGFKIHQHDTEFYERDRQLYLTPDTGIGDEFLMFDPSVESLLSRVDNYTYTFGKDGSNDMSLQKVDGIATEEHKLGKRPEFKDQDSISIGRQESFLPEGRRNDDISFNDSTTKRITKMLRDARLKKIRDSHYKVETDDENRRIINQNIKYYRDRYNAAINDGVSSMNDVISRASSSFRKNGNVVWLKEFNLFLQDMEAEGVPSNDLFKLKNDIYNEMNISSEKITIGSVQRNLLLHSDHVEYDQGTLERETPFSSPEGVVEEIRNSDLKRLPKSSNLNGTTAIFLDGPGYNNPIAVFIKPVNFRDMAIVEIVSNQDYGKRNMEYSGENSPPLHGVDATAETAMFFYNRGKGDGRQVQQVLPLGTQNRWKDHDSIAYNPSNYSKEENEILGRVHSPGGKGYIKSILGAFNNDDGKSALAKAREKFIHSHSAVEKSGLLLREKMREKGEILEFSEMAFADVILSQRANGVLAAALKYGVPVIERALNWRLTKAETGSFELRNDPDLPQVYTKKYGGFIDIINPLMDEIGVRDNLMHKFFVILVSRRARRLQSMGMRVPEGVDDSYHGVADKFLEDNPEMSVIIDNFMEWNNKLLDYAVDAELLSESLGAELKRTMDYVSFSREFNEEGILDVDKLWQGTSEPVRRREGRMQDPKQPEKFAEGTEGKLKDFLSSVASNAYSLIQESMNNMASEAVVKEQRKLYGEESVFEAGAVDANGVKRNKVKDVLNPNSITYRDKGVKRTFVVPDGAVAGAMKGTIGVKDPFVENFLTSFSRILREGVTRSPGFIWRNTVKDAQMLYMLVDQDVDEQFLLPFKSIGNAVKNIFRGQNYFTEEFLALESTGSAGGFELGTVHNPTAKGLQKLMNENSRGEISINPIKTFYKIWDGLGVASAKAETSAREEIYKLTMARTNGNVKEATIQAIEFLNFNRRGGNKNFQNLLKLSPFLSAGINGVDVILRKSKGEHTMDASLTKSQVRKRALTRMAYLSAIGFTQAALWGELDDEEWKSYSEDIVLTNTLIPIFGTDASIAFPAPFELGFFTHTLPTLLYRTLKGDVDYNLSKSLKKGAFHSIKTLPSVGLPQAIAPLVGIGGHPWSESRGWNPFLESPVIPEHIPPGRMAYTTETSPIARGISSVIGGSPMKWEHLYLYGGTMAVNFMALADSIVRVIPGLEPEDEIPGDWTRDLDFWLKDPNISAIVKKASDSGQMQRFYEKYEAAEELAYAIRTLNIENVSKSREVKDENWKLYRKTGTLRRTKSVLERFNKRIKKIKYRKDLSGGEKQERIDRIKVTRKKYLKKIEANTSDLDMKVWGFGKYRD